MKIKLYLILLLSLLGWCNIQAQDKIVFGDESAFQRVSFMPCRIKDSLLIGNSNISVKYRLTRKINDNTYGWCFLKLTISNSISCQLDLHDYANSLIMSDVYKGRNDIDERLIEMGMNNGDASSNLFLQIVRNDSLHTLQVSCSDMQITDRTRMYEEPIPEMNWCVTNKIDSICGYTCTLATAQFRGRTWSGWFTTEIPVSLGPWKLSGLPGLILKAADESGVYEFECVELSAEKVPVYVYDYPNKQIISRREYLKYEKNSYVHPYELLAGGENVVIWKKGTDGSVSEVKESWVIPYNPIELE
ncbi:MAG: GLPGLI family protein [Lachnospiraceae bacterium]|nr:GLPGLI family protein [Lachnospiraceae bacterium]